MNDLVEGWLHGHGMDSPKLMTSKTLRDLSSEVVHSNIPSALTDMSTILPERRAVGRGGEGGEEEEGSREGEEGGGRGG